MAELTPMMRQYCEIKKSYPDTILMFRLGDFYEMFFEDAKVASKELELVLTGKDCGQEERAPMCGIPYHAADSYIAKLVSRGYKVAVCEQLEDPATAKGLVKRDVTRILTPGTVVDSTMLESDVNNYLCCVFAEKEKIGLCFADISAGIAHAFEFSGDEAVNDAISEFVRFSPKEIISNKGISGYGALVEYIRNKLGKNAEVFDDGYFDFQDRASLITDNFNIDGLLTEKILASDAACTAICGDLRYLQSVQKRNNLKFSTLEFDDTSKLMSLDRSAQRNLEIVKCLNGENKKGTLLWVLKRTKTSMGARKLNEWIVKPLTNIGKITSRSNAVEELYNNSALLDDMQCQIAKIRDPERLISKIYSGNCDAVELKSLSNSLKELPRIKEMLSTCRSGFLSEQASMISVFDSLTELIDAAILENPSRNLHEGGMIAPGFNAELDELNELKNNNQGYLMQIQAREQERTGIKKLKIGYNRVFGYYIEVSNSFKELVPDDYIRKQTLTNCERFITQELKELEARVLSASTRAANLEFEIFDRIRAKAAENIDSIQLSAKAVAQTDVICAFADVARKNNYVKPQINSSTYIDIKDGRHPVVELMTDEPFVPNDTYLDLADKKCAIITGPNMAGKSTYMRQVALICLMTQIGSFVPCKSADMCIIDGIYTRIGASDDLNAGSSTFMVEMTEVADILKAAKHKKNSLIIFDEIGRGTSTYDGMSIARAVLEYASSRLKAKTLFATHYHELTDIEGQAPGTFNLNVTVNRTRDRISFLRKIVPGRADGSFGIDVAKLAGIDNSIIKRANEILMGLESEEPAPGIPQSYAAPEEEVQMSFEGNRGMELLEEIKQIDINVLTPIEAMSVLNSLIKKAKN